MPKTAQKDASVATVKKQGAVMKHIKKYWQSVTVRAATC